MRVEPATLADLDRVIELWVDLATEQQSHGAHLKAESNRTLMREALAQHVVDHTCLLAMEEPDSDPVIVGFVSFSMESDGLDRDVGRGVVHNLYVEPGARNRGIGTALLEAAEAALRTAGAERIVLQALARNDDARRFYERQGYEPHRVTYERPLEGAGDG